MINRYILTLFSLILFSQILYAGAWNRIKGSGYTQLSFTYLNYGRLHNGNNEKIDLKRNIGDNTLHFYGEYGLSNTVNLLLNVPYKMVSSGTELNQVKFDPYYNDTLNAGNLSGFSNLGAGLRFKLIERKFVISAQVLVFNRIHQYQNSTGLRIGYDAWLFSPSLLFGKGWNKTYFQFEIGTSINTNVYAQNLIGNTEIGFQLWNKNTYAIARVDWKLPFNTGTFDEGNSVQTALFRDNSSYISPGVKFILGLTDQWFLNLGVYGGVYAKYEGTQATYNAGVAYQW
jgi:hypothetical protein